MRNNNPFINEFPFLYETHMQTSESSACAIAGGREMARAYKDAGYAGVIITDHNWGGNTRISSELAWKDWVEEFFKGYEAAKEEGDRIGLDVFFGYEAGYNGTEFLIYGPDKEWMLAHPELREASIEEQYRLIAKDRGMVIHAHPYREEWYIPEILLFPESIDGVEGINAAHSNSESKFHNKPEFNTRAVAYAEKYKKPVTAGSDMHSTELLGGGTAFRTRLNSIGDYIKRIKSGQEYVLTDGENWYDCTGQCINEAESEGGHRYGGL